MNDTAPGVAERFRAMLMARTGEERLIMGCAMRDSARMIVEAFLRADDPRATVQTIRKGLFLRFTGMSSMPTPALKSSPPLTKQPSPPVGKLNLTTFHLSR